jgi:hypothetical protein
MDLTLVRLVNKAKEKEIAQAKAIAYSRKCRRSEIRNWILFIIIIIVIGVIGTMELHAEPDYVIEQQAKEMGNYYPTSGIVTAVGEDFMVFTDFNGNEWEVNGDPEDWYCGDICTAIMDKNGTEIIYDDEVVSTKYSGWIY